MITDLNPADRRPSVGDDCRFLMTEARRRNLELNEREFAERRTRLESKPLALFIELTMNCNLKCPMCRSAEKYQSSFNLSPALFERIADELFPTALLVDLRGWGESTILRSFGDVVRAALPYRAQLRLVTNGQVNRRQVWDDLMRAHAMIAVSCDAADPALFAELRCGGRIDRLRSTVRTIVELRDRYGVPRRNVEFITVASRANLHDLANVVELAADLDVAKVTLFPIQTKLGDPWHLHGDIEGTRAAYEAAEQRARALGILLQLGAAPDRALAIPELVKRSPCMHPWGYAYINYAGGVGFCDHLIGDPDKILGSLTETSFLGIWNGDAWADLRAQHVKGEIAERFFACRWCYKQRYVDFEDRVHQPYTKRIVSTDTVPSVIRTSPCEAENPLPFIR